MQGNAPGGGIYGIGGPRTTTYNHLKETRVLMDKVAAGQVPQPDFVVWPENGTDMDPTTDTLTDQALKDAVAATKAPLFAGIMGVNEASYTRRTIARWINADGSLGDGYEKRNMVPFGEWVPFRNILEPLFPMLSYVGEQGIPGSEPGVVTG
ncbi:MAG TPA: apolipoprotein N-acyltransferase, partial [Propionibacteriaceae bacterium]|nr:apolipoprotein N-acyltransferase [Propionibacteriaceae bacterium]